MRLALVPLLAFTAAAAAAFVGARTAPLGLIAPAAAPFSPATGPTLLRKRLALQPPEPPLRPPPLLPSLPLPLPPPLPLPLSLRPHLRRSTGGVAMISEDDPPPPSSAAAAVGFGLIAVGYWYLLVLGAAAAAGGLPVPEWLPLTPGWPPSEADLAPVLEDSANFFYIPKALELTGGPPLPPTPPLPALRLALFNGAEAWVFGLLPLLLLDPRRLPVWVVLPMWVGALGLTNAFIAPYMTARELMRPTPTPPPTTVKSNANVNPSKNTEKDQNDRKSVDGDDMVKDERMGGGSTMAKLLGYPVAAVTALVVGYALAQAASVGPSAWSELAILCARDRSYAAFAVDLLLLTLFQAHLMRAMPTAPRGPPQLRFVPLFGLVAWILLI